MMRFFHSRRIIFPAPCYRNAQSLFSSPSKTPRQPAAAIALGPEDLSLSAFAQSNHFVVDSDDESLESLPEPFSLKGIEQGWLRGAMSGARIRGGTLD